MAEISSPRVLITGAAGFIGTELRRRLAGRYQMLSVDIRPMAPLETLHPHGQPLGERRFQLDLGDLPALEAWWEGMREVYPSIVGVIHLAAFYNFDNRPDARYDRLLRGLEWWLPRLGADLPRDSVFLFASSMAAMAPTEPGVKLTPESPTLGGWQYPKSKLAAEAIMRETPIPQAVGQLVLAGVYSDACELVPLFNSIELARSRSPEKYLYPGPTDRGLTYVHLEEVGDAFARALEAFRGRPGIHRLLIGQERPLVYREIYDRASLAFHGRRMPLLRAPKWLTWIGAVVLARIARWLGKRRFIQPWMIRFAGEHFEFDISRTTSALGWRPWRDVHQDLDRMLELAVKDPARWLELNRARPW